MLGVCVCLYMKELQSLSLARLRIGRSLSWLGAKSYYQALLISDLIQMLPLGDFFFLLSYSKHKDQGSWKAVN